MCACCAQPIGGLICTMQVFGILTASMKYLLLGFFLFLIRFQLLFPRHSFRNFYQNVASYPQFFLYCQRRPLLCIATPSSSPQSYKLLCHRAPNIMTTSDIAFCPSLLWSRPRFVTKSHSDRRVHHTRIRSCANNPTAYHRASCKAPPSSSLRSVATAASLALAMLYSSLSVSPCLASDAPINGTPFRWQPQQLPMPGDADTSSNNHRPVHGDANQLLRAQWDLKSTDCSVETLLVFANETSGVVDVLWIDYCGREVFYGALNPGMTHIQQSYVTHPWIVRDHVSHNSLLVITAKADPLLAVVRNA